MEGDKLDIDDPHLEEKLVGELKSQGIFDQIRKDCLADVDTTPAYQNLRRRVDQTLEAFLQKQRKWTPSLNKNQLRNELRQEIQKISGKELVVDRIVEQVVGPKINSALLPEIEQMIYKFFDSAKPEEKELSNGLKHLAMKEEDDVEMAEVREMKAASGGSSPDLGLAGQISPITPSREERHSTSPVLNAGQISPITPSTTPPAASTEDKMEMGDEAMTPPPRPQSAYTPPPPPESYTPPPRAVVQEYSSTPPLPPQSFVQLTLNRSGGSITPPLPPGRPPQSQDSGEEGSMSGISDVSDISPPRVSPRSPPEHSASEGSPPGIIAEPEPVTVVQQRRPEQEASDVSDTELFTVEEEVVEEQKRSPMTTPPLPPSSSSDKKSTAIAAGNNSSDSEMEQLVKMRAELMAKLEGDFKLSPEEESSSDSESDAEDNENAEQQKKTEGSPTSPDESPAPPDDPEPSPPQTFSPSDNFSPPPPQGGSSPDNDGGNRSVPSPPSGRSSGEEDQERSAVVAAGGDKGPLEAAGGHMIPSPGDLEGRQLSPEPSPRSPEDAGCSESVLLAPSVGSQSDDKLCQSTANTADTDRRKYQEADLIEAPFFSGAGEVRRSLGPRTPDLASPISPEPTFSPIEEEPESRTPSPPPLPPTQPARRGPVTPPEPAEPFYLARGPVTPPSPPSAFSSSRPVGWRPPSPKEAHPDTIVGSSRVAHTPESISSTRVLTHKKEKVEKKSDKIKEQQKAKLEKVEQKVKSKDKLKSDKFQDLDIFSTTKKPFTPHQPHRPPSASVGASPVVSSSHPNGLKTPNGIKKPLKPNEFGLKLQASLKEHVSRLEQEKSSAAAKSAKPPQDFAKPAKQPDRRPSTDTKPRDDRSMQRSDSTGSSSSTRQDAADKTSSRDKDRRSDKDKKKDRDKDRLKSYHSRDKSRAELSGGENRSRHPSGSDGKSRRSSVDEATAKPGELERKKAHETFMQEAKQRLQDRREKEEKVERERRRQKEEAKRRERRLQQEKEQQEKDRLKEKISCLDINEIKKLLTETVAAKEGVTLNPKDSKLLLTTLEQIIHQKKVKKEEPKKKTSPPPLSQAKKEREVTSGKNKEVKEKEEKAVHISSSSSSSDSETEPVSPPPKRKQPAESRREEKLTGKPRRPTLNASSSDEESDEKEVGASGTRSTSRQEAVAEEKIQAKLANNARSEDAVAKVSSPLSARRVPTRDVKVNINKLAAEKVSKYKEESEDSDTDSDFEIQVEAVDEKPTKTETTKPANSLDRTVTTTTKSPAKQQKPSPARVSTHKLTSPSTKSVAATAAVVSTPLRQQATAASEASPKPLADLDPSVGQLEFFTAEEVDHMRSLRARLDSVLDNEDNISVSSVSSEELTSYIPTSRHIEVDLPSDCDTQALLEGIEKLGGGGRIIHPPPDWLVPYLKGAKLKPEDLTMPTLQEIADHLTHKEKKARKRCGGWDIVVEWVPSQEEMDSKRSRLERGLKVDPFSAFSVAASQLAESGIKRTRRANGRYLSTEYQSQDEEEVGNKDKENRVKEENENSTSNQHSTDTSKKKSSKDRIRAYLKSAGVERPEDDSGTGATNNAVIQATPETDAVAGANHSSKSEESSPQQPAPPGADRTDAVATAAAHAAVEPNPFFCSDSKPVSKAEKTATPASITVKTTRNTRRSGVQPETAVKGVDESGGLAESQPAGDANDGVDMDEELAATENEMASIIQNLLDKRKNKKKLFQEEEKEFYGWAVTEIRKPATFISLLTEQKEVLDGTGARFGMDPLDVYGLSPLFGDSSEVDEPQLEVVMSSAILRDIKKAEQHRLERRKSDLVRPVVSELDRRNGSEGSDSDDRASSSSVSSGSAKENVPNVRPKRNSLPPKINQKEFLNEGRPESRKRSTAGGGQILGGPLQKRAKV